MQLEFDVSKLLRKSEVIDLEEGKQLGKELFKFLAEHPSNLSISAPQLGIFKNVCAINVSKPLLLINPKIVGAELPIPYLESTYTHPNELFDTIRFARIIITADNLEGKHIIGVQRDQDIKDFKISDPAIVEACAIQQASDYLLGLDVIARKCDNFMKTKTEPIVRSGKKIGRNEKITLFRGEETLDVKAKYFEKYIVEGWKLKN